jgi:hypothetical protein
MLCCHFESKVSKRLLIPEYSRCSETSATQLQLQILLEGAKFSRTVLQNFVVMNIAFSEQKCHRKNKSGLQATYFFILAQPFWKTEDKLK